MRALTGRQLRILQLISFGPGNNEIAATLTISPETVRTHVKYLWWVLDVKNRAHAVTVAYARGVLDAHRVSWVESNFRIHRLELVVFSRT